MAGSEQGIAYPLYERVERERVLRGWSKTRFHRETGIARSTIDKWATQPKTPQPGTVNVVADSLGIGREEALRLAGILTDGAPADAPAEVRASWDDENVRALWGLSVGEDQRMSLVGAYLAQKAVEDAAASR